VRSGGFDYQVLDKSAAKVSDAERQPTGRPAPLQGEWIVQMLGHLRQHDFKRFEATVPAEQAWRAEVLEIADSTLFPRTDSWYFGANIPGKRREMLSYAGGLSTYMAKCNESAERGYEGFAIS
jgi:hypothetical protein